jgi:hypothetical protein
MKNDIYYEKINNHIADSSNIVKIRYAELFKEYPYFAVENTLTVVDDNNIEYSSIVFITNKDDVKYSEKHSMFQLTKGASRYKCSTLSASKKGEVPSDIYESKFIKLPETKEYSFDNIHALTELEHSPNNTFGFIFGALEDKLSFCDYESKNLNVEDKNIRYQTVYSNTTGSGKYGYEVHRVLFKDNIVGYLTCEDKYLESQEFVISSSKDFQAMIEYIEENFNNKEIDFSSDTNIVSLFDAEFLHYVDQNKFKKE